jgi:ABC-type nitrate/sulfonate/bicarbonate transport system permease component
MIAHNNQFVAKLKNAFVRVFFVTFFLIIWEIVSRLNIVNPLLFPAPSVILSALIDWAVNGGMWNDVKASLWRMLTGFIIGGSIGISLGMLTARVKFFKLSLGPTIQLLRPLPPVAIIPIVIVWLGIGDTAKIFSISFAVFFPVWINTHIGASSVSRVYLWSSQTLCKSKLKTMFKVFIPATLPSIIAGLRTSISIAFIMVYVSEIAGASKGIGYQISVYHLAYRIDKMMAALLVLAVAGAVTDLLFTRIVRFVFPWTTIDGK